MSQREDVNLSWALHKNYESQMSDEKSYSKQKISWFKQYGQADKVVYRKLIFLVQQEKDQSISLYLLSNLQK